MIGSNALYQIDQRIKKALYYILTSCIGVVNSIVLDNVMNLPFGGIHVYMSGK